MLFPVYSDTQTHWARGEISFASMLGIIPPDSTDRFNPDRPITNLEAYEINVRLLGWSLIFSGLIVGGYAYMRLGK